MDDVNIILLFFQRSERAIEELANKYGKLCKKLSYNILNNDSDADECVNDTYIKTWNSIPPQNPDNLMAYVCKIVRNISLNLFNYNNRQKRRGKVDAILSELDECIPSDYDLQSDLDCRIRRSSKNISERADRAGKPLPDAVRLNTTYSAT